MPKRQDGNKDTEKNKMENNQTNKNRVVLNLTTQLAEHLRSYLSAQNCSDDLKKIQTRIEKTLTKHRILKGFAEQKIEPTKDRVKRAMDMAMGVITTPEGEIKEVQHE